MDPDQFRLAQCAWTRKVGQQSASLEVHSVLDVGLDNGRIRGRSLTAAWFY